MSYNTNNPVGSTDPRDLYDNAGNLDKFVNGDQPFYADRLGKQRLSYSGMEHDFQNSQEGREAEFQQFLADAAFVFIGNYAGSLTFTNRSQYTIRDSVPYRLAPSATVPYTTSGNWALESSSFTPINSDDILRQDLAAADGSSKVAFVAAGGSTVPTTVQARLRKIVVRSDYSTDAAFNAAAASAPNIDASNNFAAPVLPTGGGAAIALGDTARDAKAALVVSGTQFPSGTRPVVKYGSASTVVFPQKLCPWVNFVSMVAIPAVGLASCRWQLEPLAWLEVGLEPKAQRPLRTGTQRSHLQMPLTLPPRSK